MFFGPKCAHFLCGVSAEDFRRTACTSLLQHVVELSSYRRAKEEELHLSEGTRKYVQPDSHDSAI